MRSRTGVPSTAQHRAPGRGRPGPQSCARRRPLRALHSPIFHPFDRRRGRPAYGPLARRAGAEDGQGSARPSAYLPGGAQPSAPPGTSIPRLAGMAEEGVQHLGWDGIETVRLPQFETEPTLVAATLARFVGSLYEDGGRRIRKGPGWPPDRLLRHISGLCRNRRPLAGGFPDGYRDYGDPLHRPRHSPTCPARRHSGSSCTSSTGPHPILSCAWSRRAISGRR